MDKGLLLQYGWVRGGSGRAVRRLTIGGVSIPNPLSLFKGDTNASRS